MLALNLTITKIKTEMIQWSGNERWSCKVMFQKWNNHVWKPKNWTRNWIILQIIPLDLKHTF